MLELNLFKRVKEHFLAGKAVITVLDQAVISGVNFFISFMFIYFSTPEKYGVYTFFMSLFNLFASIQNALINTPMIVLSPRMNTNDSSEFRKGLFALLLLYIIIVFNLIFLISIKDNQLGNIIATFLVSISICFMLIRDYYRTEEYAQIRPESALKRDLLYCVLSIFMIFIINFSNEVNVQNVFLVIGLSSILISLPKIFRFIKKPPEISQIYNSTQKSWVYSRWSILGATASWIQGNSYIYVPYILLGAREVAYLSAARLLMTPIALLIGSFGNIVRPIISKFLSSENESAAKKVVYKSILILILVLCLYSVFVGLIINYLPSKLLPEDYQGIGKYIVVWTFYYTLKILRTCFSYYMQASLFFKQLAIVGMAVSLICLLVTLTTVHLIGNVGALIGLIISEFLMFVSILLYIKHSRRKHVSNKISL